ncbi:MAG: hypothetical protein HYZ75_18020 [Elusimicrobia bacterium]|nr:hypothetical protein [Elusimicrobiota bacterium]
MTPPLPGQAPLLAPEFDLRASLARLAAELEHLERAGAAAGDKWTGRVLLELCAFIRDRKAQQAFAALPPDPAVEERCRAIQALALRLYAAFECRRAGVPRECAQPFDAFLESVSEFADSEIHAARITRNSLVVFIGSGAYPATAIKLARFKRCRVLCLYRDARAAEAARALFAALELGERLTAACLPLAAGDLSEATHFFIASQVDGKERLLDEVYAASGPQVKAVVRYGNGLKRLFNHELARIPDGRWTLLSHLDTAGHIHDTAILGKRPSAA